MGNSLHIPHQQQQELQQVDQSTPEETQEFTCEICIEPTSNPDNRFRNANKCSHPFCTDCMIKYITVKLCDDNIGIIKCPAVNCANTLDPLSCATLVGPLQFVRWCDVLCEAAITGLDRCYCPYRNCNVLIVNECGGQVRKSQCPKCRRWLCFECKGVWHAGFGCEENVAQRDRNDVAFGILVEQKKWKRCPGCRHFVELVEGCRIVKCRCGISFCYKCGKPATRHLCHCDHNAPITWIEWCFWIFIVISFFTYAIFLYREIVIKRQQ